MVIEKLKTEIRRLLKERKAILLAHNYQLPEIQDVADLTGDSLDLSVKAAQTDAEVIAFCGVRFMAETAAVLCADKTVILPRLDAGCEMADMISADALRAQKTSLPDVPVVTYVNSTAEVKAESDICCTSANAIKVVNSLANADVVLMTPDRNLAQYTQRHTPKKIIYWEGYCPIHEVLTPQDVLKAKEEHPEALFLAHPECRPEVIDLADAVRSTTGMLSFVHSSRAKEFIIGTEVGLLYPLQKQNPMKRCYPASDKMVCEHMKLTHLEDVITALSELKNVIRVSEEVRIPAKKAVDRMLEVPRD